jgi:hypothetical protein
MAWRAPRRFECTVTIILGRMGIGTTRKRRKLSDRICSMSHLSDRTGITVRQIEGLGIAGSRTGESS